MVLLNGAAPEPIAEGTDQSFPRDVIDASRTTPVLVDFWAPWCGPCRQLTPLLEKAVRAANGKVRLVKINIDENPVFAGQMGVQSIPAVFAFAGGRPVDGFLGLVPESQITALINRLSGAANGAADEVAGLLAAANDSFEQADFTAAAQAYAGVLQRDPTHPKALAGLARVYFKMGDAAQARRILDMAPEDKANDPDIAAVRASMELASQAPDTGDSEALRARVAANPSDFNARFDLANALASHGDLEHAAEELLAIIERDRSWNDEAARKQLLKIFEASGAASELAKSGRRRLSAILFS